MGDQLSFENTLFERERELLLVTGAISKILTRLHYERTKITATLGVAKSKKHVGALSHSNLAATSALSWLSQLQYNLSEELSDISGMERRASNWYEDSLNSDIFVEDAITTPYSIYQGYIGVYRSVTKIFDDHKELFSSINGCNTYIREFYVDMQTIGEEIEEII